MSKNTQSQAFRKLDVDQYNEDNYKEEDVGDQGGVGPDEAEVTNLLNVGKNLDALKIVLRNAPINTKNQQIKEGSFNLTIRVLLSIKTSQMEDSDKSLSPSEVDVLMKYIYKGWEKRNEQWGGHLLAWHEKAFAAGGLGSIVRVLSDRKRV